MKWIRCDVIDRSGFDRGQQAWASLYGLSGFLGQRGGWQQHSAGIAHIVAFWADHKSYDSFMVSAHHDALAAGQHHTFGNIDIRLFEDRLHIGARLIDTPGIGLLRLDHCRAKADRIEHFIQAQSAVWNPDMNEATGFVGGMFGQCDAQEFLVLTQWSSASTHARYQSEQFSTLQDQAATSGDFEATRGYLIELEPCWSVAATR